MSRKGSPAPQARQPEPDASSDGDASWTADPQTQDPHEDRSVEAVVRRTAKGGTSAEGGRGTFDDEPSG